MNKIRDKVLLGLLSILRILILFLVNQIPTLVFDQLVIYNLVDLI